jgi:hypothetical protein
MPRNPESVLFRWTALKGFGERYRDSLQNTNSYLKTEGLGDVADPEKWNGIHNLEWWPDLKNPANEEFLETLIGSIAYDGDPHADFPPHPLIKAGWAIEDVVARELAIYDYHKAIVTGKLDVPPAIIANDEWKYTRAARLAHATALGPLHEDHRNRRYGWRDRSKYIAEQLFYRAAYTLGGMALGYVYSEATSNTIYKGVPYLEYTSNIKQDPLAPNKKLSEKEYEKSSQAINGYSVVNKRDGSTRIFTTMALSMPGQTEERDLEPQSYTIKEGPLAGTNVYRSFCIRDQKLLITEEIIMHGKNLSKQEREALVKQVIATRSAELEKYRQEHPFSKKFEYLPESQIPQETTNTTPISTTTAPQVYVMPKLVRRRGCG